MLNIRETENKKKNREKKKRQILSYLSYFDRFIGLKYIYLIIMCDTSVVRFSRQSR